MFERFFGLEGINSEVIRALVTGGVPALNCEAVQVYHQGAGEITLLDTVRHYAWRVSEQSGEVLGVSILDESNSATLAVAQRTVKAQQRVIEITLYKPAQAEAQMFVARFNAKPNISSELFEVAVPSGYTQDSCD
jgi:hypothetical protein